VGQVPHPDGVFDDRPLMVVRRVDPEPVVGLDDRNDPLVGVLTEARVEANLFLTVLMALFQRREVEKAQLDGLFDLVDEGRHESHQRDVSFLKRHRVRLVRIRGGILEGVTKCVGRGHQRLWLVV